jgi:hypothetical protein
MIYIYFFDNLCITKIINQNITIIKILYYKKFLNELLLDPRSEFKFKF